MKLGDGSWYDSMYNNRALVPDLYRGKSTVEQEEAHHLMTGLDFGDADGWVTGLKCQKMQLGEPDASGRARPIPIEGSEFVLPVDNVVLAIGTTPNPLLTRTTSGLMTNKKGCLVADEHTGLTSKALVFAGGDAVTGAATVILAAGAGKRSAQAIHEALQKVPEAAH